MTKLIISGLGGSLFPYLHTKLFDNYELFYIDNDESLRNLYPEYNFFNLPLVTDPSYPDLVKNLISQHKIDYYIPLIDEELLIAKGEIEGFNGVVVLTPTVDFCELCLDKCELMQYLSSAGISFIESYPGNNFDWQIEPPLFVKPIRGRGSRGIRKIQERNQLEAYYLLESYLPEQILIQPLITGVEYTVGITTNNLNNLLSISSKRIIHKKGITRIAISEDNNLIDEVARKVVDGLNPKGPFNIQLIITPENEVKIFEINPRFSTTTIMEFEGGLDLISLYIQNFNREYRGEVLRPRAGQTIHRRWESVFYGG